MFASFLLYSALMTTPVLAQTTSAASDVPPCPVKIVNVNPTGNDSLGHGMLSGNAHAKDGRMFVLKVQNQSGKDIKGMKFQAAYLDATEDSTDLPVAWNWTDALKTGDEKSFRWENIYAAESKIGWKVRLVKVLYEDGSKWEPASGQVCSGDYFRDKHHK